MVMPPASWINASPCDPSSSEPDKTTPITRPLPDGPVDLIGDSCQIAGAIIETVGRRGKERPRLAQDNNSIHSRPHRRV